jgi:hypothetical protein
MGRRGPRRVTAATLSCAAVTVLFACGSRTELIVPNPSGGPPLDADASSPFDAANATDASDASDARDASDEADASEADVIARCGDGGPSEVAYVLDSAGTLYRYYPDTGQEIVLGTPSCGDSSVPWTMTAGRDHAYIVYTDWSIFSVDLATLDCFPTPFDPSQLGLDDEFGVALSGSGASERLYYYGLPSGSSTAILATSDTVSFALTLVGNVDPMTPEGPLFPVNLTSDNAGHLFAYAPEPSGYLMEIDAATGAVLLAIDESLPSGPPYATLSYEGSAYLFAENQVTQFAPPAPGPLSSRMVNVGAIGAGSYVVCP